MATLSVSIEDLRQALEGISALLGEPGKDGSPGSGLAGAASLAGGSPAANPDGVGAELSGQLDGVLQVDTGQLGDVSGLLLNVQARAQAPPADALAAFTGRLTRAASALDGDAVAPMRQALEAITGLSGGIPSDQTAIVSVLVDQLVRVLASLDSEEARTVRAWVSSVQEQAKALLPLIGQAQAGHPAALAVAVVERSLGGVLDLLGAGELANLLSSLDRLLDNPLDGAAVTGLTGALDLTAAGYGTVVASLDADLPAFRAATVATADALRDLKLRLRGVLAVLRRVAGARILAPGELEAYLRAKLDEALGLQIHETQKIDDPFRALFDRIDSAIEGIDLGPVRDQILGFFADTREAIEGVDLSSIGDAVNAQLAAVESAIGEVEAGLAELKAQIAAFFTAVGDQIRSLFEPVGQFQPNGTFRYGFETELRSALTSARLAIAGDPASPDAPSVSGTLARFQAEVDALAGQLHELLVPVDQQLSAAVDQARAGIQSFGGALDELDIPGTVDRARQELQEVMDAIGDLEFSTVVDAVVGGLDEATGKVRSIDPESINPTIGAALGAALGLVVEFDFSGLVRAPLHDAVTSISAEAVAEIQAAVARVLAALDEISPTRLLSPLFDAAEVINAAVGSLDLDALLDPLDELHQRHLREPIGRLRPSTLLHPITEAFAAAERAFAAVDGATIVAPLESKLDALKAAADGFDVGGRIDELVGAVDTVSDRLGAISPGALLEPLVTELERIDTELDRLKPSALFAPVAQLAAPLLTLLEGVQQAAVQALFDLFKAPLALLDRLEPAALAAAQRQRLQLLLDAVAAIDLHGRVAELGRQHLAIRGAVEAGGVKAKADLVIAIDPGRQLDGLLAAHDELVALLTAARDAMALPNLAGLYARLRERVLGLLPPYARELLDVDTFKRVMRLADPTRFLTELDQRFETIKQKLVPISPDELAAELDADWQALVGVLDGLDMRATLEQVKTTFERIEGVLDGVGLDQIAAGVDGAVAPVRAVVAGLDPGRFVADLDALHGEVEAVVDATKPSEVLAGLRATLDEVKAIVARLDLRSALGPPLDQAWEAVTADLGALDVRLLLQPLVDKLAELEVGLEVGLDRIEGALDDLLRAAQTVMSASGGGGVGVGVGGGG